ncbi:MAG: hypothetical protein ACRBFS_14845 [Aureispira sp.]
MKKIYFKILYFLSKKINIFNLNSTSRDYIEGSTYYNKQKHGDNNPLVISRKHLMYKDVWKNWAFSIVILLKNKIILSKNRDKFTLELDLTEESIGIYNNRGKSYLASRLLAKDSKMREFKDANSKIEKLFFSSNPYEELDLSIHPLPSRCFSA